MRAIMAGAALIVALFQISQAVAQDVTLTARNGGLALTGQLQGYDGEFYRITTVYGRLTVDAEGVICDGPACPDLTAPLALIRIVGAGDTALRLLPPLFAAFATARGLDYAPVTSAESFAADITDPITQKPLARINFTAMTPDAAERAVAAEDADLILGMTALPGLRARAVALEPLIAIAAAENTLPHMRSADLAAALTGQVTNWQALGGPDMPIVVHAIDGTDALQAAMSARVGGMLVAGPRQPDASSLARAVARDPWALALTGQSDQGGARAVPLTDACDFPLPATPLTVKAGDYPLTVPIFLLSPRRRLPLMTREFLEFLATDTAQKVVAAAGYIDRRLGQAPLTDDGQRLLGAIRNAGTEVPLPELQRLAAAMTGGERLSFTFRFQDGSAQLDAHSRENIDDLGRLIGAGRFHDRKLVFAGFSDGTGSAGVNLDLSRSRAQAVRSALQTAAPDLTDASLPGIDAFGEALPMSCDSTAIGRQINRRVELWSYPAAPG